jgi:hypothetical protein
MSVVFCFTPVPACAQNHFQETMHHPMRMQHTGMHHAVSHTAKLTVSDDASGRAWVIRVGPVNLPAHADHMSVAQPQDFYIPVEKNAWLTAFHPRLVDAAGNPVPSKLLHHAAFWNTTRPDFLCPNKEEHIFGAGGEMNDWPGVPGFGYRVRSGDRIRVSTMFANPTDAGYPSVYLEIREEYELAGPGADVLKSVYPVWFDVMGCQNSGYDLAPGHNVTSHTFTFGYDGILLGAGGHLHDYGRLLVLDDPVSKQPVAELRSSLDSASRILAMPIERFDGRGFALRKGEPIRVTATYDNPSARRLPEGAMGIVVGWFLPADGAKFVAMARTPRK